MKKARSTVISSTTGKVAFNTLSQGIGKAAHLIIALVITALVTRALGRAGYGDYSLARNFMLLFTLGIDFGLNAIVVREIARRKDAAQYYLENLISLRLLISSLLILSGIGLLFLTPYTSAVEKGIVITLLILIPWSLATTANVIFQTNFRYDLATIAFILGELVTLFLVFVGVSGGWGLYFILATGLIGHIVMAVLSYVLARRLGIRFSLGRDWKLWRTLLITAFPLGVMLAFSQINQKADLFLISLLPLPARFGLGRSETIGVYSLAYQLFTNVIVLPTFFMNAFYPIMVADYKEDRARFARRFKKAMTILFGAGLAAFAVGFVFAPWIITIVAGGEFGHSVVALRLLLLGIPLFYLTSPLQWFLLTSGREKVLPLIYGAGAAFNIVFNLLFIPRFSYQASAVITWVTEGLILIMLVVALFSSETSEHRSFRASDSGKVR